MRDRGHYEEAGRTSEAVVASFEWEGEREGSSSQAR
jgi:hypothetical protein